MSITEELQTGDVRSLRDAACKDSPAEWFDEASAAEDHREAANVCRRCPIIVKCRMQAERDTSASGVWAGRLWKSRDGASKSRQRRDSAITL